MAPLGNSSAEYAQAIVDTIRQPLLVLDADMRVRAANPAFYRQFSVPAERTLGSVLWDLGSGEWKTAALRELLESVLVERGAIEDFEMHQTFPSLGPRILLVNARILHGGTPFILMAFEDVTEQRRSAHLVAERSRQLERSNRDLEEFAHAASHDLQEPLRKVRAFADRLISSLPVDSLDARQQQYVSGIQSAAARMQKRIDDLLMLARVSRARPQPANLELAEVVGRVLRDLDHVVQREDAAIEVSDLPVLQADASQIELLFQNLISNALKYRSAERRPVVRIVGEKLRRRDADWVRIVVADNGIGFDPQYAERIFRPFERLHGRAEYEGSGVGLSICRRVAEQHGGTIAAEGVSGEGARFTIELPAIHPELEEVGWI